MFLLQQIEPLYSLSGLAVGILVGLTGVGGGSLMTPLLVLAFSIHPSTADEAAEDCASTTWLKGVGAVIVGRIGSVDCTLLASLLIGSIPGIIIGSLAASRAPEGLLKTLLAITLALVGVKLLT